MAVYLIRAGEAGPVKIGHARNVAARLRGFQTAHYERLTLLRTWPGGQPEEAALHHAFSEYRVGGEWFRFCEAMLTADPAALIGIRVPATMGATRDHLRPLMAKINAHLEATGTPPSTFGTRAVGDPNFVRDLRAGREPRSRVVAKVIEFIDGVQSRAAA